MEKNKYSKNLNKYEQLYFLIEDYAKEYSKFLEDKDNRTNENRCERYYKKVYDFVKQELDKAREEGFDSGVKRTVDIVQKSLDELLLERGEDKYWVGDILRDCGTSIEKMLPREMQHYKSKLKSNKDE